ncbi:MAG TPA: hypothetical protein VFW49_12495 [Fluviicoccus sp.]|nr:hypothetical protein [Fluviicoccus sp.]
MIKGPSKFWSKTIVAGLLTTLLAGCDGRMGHIPRTINDVKVNVLHAEPTRNNSGIPISSTQDQDIVSSIMVIPSEGDRTYALDPPVSSDDTIISDIIWRSGQAYIHISSKGSPLSVIDNSRECSERAFIFFCTQYTQQFNYTVLESGGNEYKVRGWDGTNTHTALSDDYLVFDDVPASSLASFRIRGIGWSSANVEVGISSEESYAVSELRNQLKQAAPNLSFHAFSMLLNRQISNPYATQILMDELLSYTNNTNDVLAYATVIESLNDNVISAAPRVKELAVSYLLAVYSTQVKGSNDTVKIANFLATDGRQLPSENFDNIFNEGVSIEMQKIESVFNALDSVSTLEQLWHRFMAGETIQDRKEKFLRSVYFAALEEKRNNRPIRAMMIYKALIGSKMTSDSSVAFELQRDQEMREFLSEQFEKIRAGQVGNTENLINELRSMSSQLAASISRVAENTQYQAESREEERQRNARMASDMFFENRYLESAYKY